jgi:hypothetical protein
MVQQARAARHGAKFGLKADQPARGDHVVEAHTAAAVGLHVLEFRAAAAERRHDVALGIAVGVHGDLLVGLVGWPSTCLMTTRGRETAIS